MKKKKDIKEKTPPKQQVPSRLTLMGPLSHRSSLPVKTSSNTPAHMRTGSAPDLVKEEATGSRTSLFSRVKTEKSVDQQAKEEKAKKNERRQTKS